VRRNAAGEPDFDSRWPIFGYGRVGFWLRSGSLGAPGRTYVQENSVREFFESLPWELM